MGGHVVFLLSVGLSSLALSAVSGDGLCQARNKKELVHAVDTIVRSTSIKTDNEAQENDIKQRLLLSDSQGWTTDKTEDVLLEFDFGSPQTLVGFATRGGQNRHVQAWTTGYRVFTKLTTDSEWKPYLVENTEVLVGNVNAMDVKEYSFGLPLIARFFRLEVVASESLSIEQHQGYVGMRIAVYACEPSDCKPIRMMEQLVNAEGCRGLIPRSRCLGTCHSLQIVDIDSNTLVSKCLCCGATSVTEEDIILTCKNGEEVVETARVIESCGCEICT